MHRYSQCIPVFSLFKLIKTVLIGGYYERERVSKICEITQSNFIALEDPPDSILPTEVSLGSSDNLFCKNANLGLKY